MTLEILSQIPIFWQVFFLAMLPVGELRIAIPLGIAMGMSPLACFSAAVIGNFLPVLPLMLLLKPLLQKISHFPAVRPFWQNYKKRLQSKSDKVERYGALGLILMVAVPLPLTGVWSGCAVAYLLGINQLRALAAMFGGVLIAGIVVLLASLGVWELAELSYGPPIILLLCAFVVIAYLRHKKRKKKYF